MSLPLLQSHVLFCGLMSGKRKQNTVYMLQMGRFSWRNSCLEKTEHQSRGD